MPDQGEMSPLLYWEGSQHTHTHAQRQAIYRTVRTCRSQHPSVYLLFLPTSKNKGCEPLVSALCRIPGTVIVA